MCVVCYNTVRTGDVLLDRLQSLRHLGQHRLLLRLHLRLLLAAVQLLLHGDGDDADGDVDVLAHVAAHCRTATVSCRTL